MKSSDLFGDFIFCCYLCIKNNNKGGYNYDTGR